ncbi:diacylglycerol kinase [Fructilactobacillus fructivorans]|uniref:diacylglycerol kinase n=1 Tax=Fructilactobacillus fructivorans TaxID=1614 RepID=UPI0007054472|nr:diacylglycerol kinase [Fructilactobacillus fructivorans]KRN42688.1 lipid kinase [Fructilactobacillus fructivorans]
MVKKARVIYNPTSGREMLKPQLVNILNVLENGGYEASAFATTPKPHSARDEATRASKEGFDLIVAAGGDGTINEVINGIAPLDYRPELGIIPAGTTNDFARALHIPRDDYVEAARVITKGNVSKMDVGKAYNDEITNYFINIAAGGFMTELTYNVPSDLKTIFGYLAYLVKGAEMLPNVKPVPMHLKYDGGEYRGKASMFFLAMTNSVGGFEQIVPNAAMDDGKFTMIIVKTGNLVEMLQLIAKAFNGGRHIDDPRIIYKKTNTFEAFPEDESRLQINLDGDYGGDAPMKFVDLKQRISIYSNLKTDDISESSSVAPQVKNAEKKFVKKVDELPSDSEK